MFRYVIMGILAFSVPSMAHFQLGKYQGKLEDGSVCEVIIESVRFENGLQHPLNERVAMTINFLGSVNVNTKVEGQHLAVVDSMQGTVRPKPGVLTAYNANKTGAEAIELIMNHEGPVQLVSINDNYQNSDLSTRVVCSGLTYLP